VFQKDKKKRKQDKGFEELRMDAPSKNPEGKGKEQRGKEKKGNFSSYGQRSFVSFCVPHPRCGTQKEGGN